MHDNGDSASGWKKARKEEKNKSRLASHKSSIIVTMGMVWLCLKKWCFLENTVKKKWCVFENKNCFWKFSVNCIVNWSGLRKTELRWHEPSCTEVQWVHNSFEFLDRDKCTMFGLMKHHVNEWSELNHCEQTCTAVNWEQHPIVNFHVAWHFHLISAWMNQVFLERFCVTTTHAKLEWRRNRVIVQKKVHNWLRDIDTQRLLNETNAARCVLWQWALNQWNWWIVGMHFKNSNIWTLLWQHKGWAGHPQACWSLSDAHIFWEGIFEMWISHLWKFLSFQRNVLPTLDSHCRMMIVFAHQQRKKTKVDFPAR